jgi:hypothetical protein
MRAYKFLNTEFGLKSLRERRLKQSRIYELNDPFELRPYDITDLVLRQTVLKTRDDLDKDGRGLVCFSADWCDPVIWAHYSDKHIGLCLGFEIPEMKGDDVTDACGRVCYIQEPLSFPANFEDLPDSEALAIMRKFLFTKFAHWAYESEIRVWVPLQNEEKGLHYLEFDEKLHLAEVIIGARCTLTRAAIAQALGTLAGEVKIIKARAAYDGFRMVEDERLDSDI